MPYRIRRIIHPLVIKLPALKIKLRLIKENAYKLKENGSVIFACNHACFYDTTAALQSIGRHAYVLGGKQRLYAADRFFVWLNGAIWVNRTDQRGRAKAKEKIIRYLKKKHWLLWFPEGTWNLTDHLLMLPMRWGIIEAAMRTEAEIVPMVLDYDREKMSCRIRFGDAYRVPKNADKEEEIRKLRDKMAELRWNFYERQKITKRADLDIGKMRDEILLAVKEYPPLDWEYEKTVIFRQTASQ